MSRFRRHEALAPRGRSGQPGFTLVEVLVAVAILVVMCLLLVSMSNTAAKIYMVGLGQNQFRLQARAVLNYMGRDLRRATLAMNQAAAINASTTQPTLQFLINPTTVTYNNPDSIFWQAPIATDGGASGDMAEVGYFVRWTAGEGDLCRFFVNPSDTTNYSIYRVTSGSWVSSTILDSVSPSDGGADHYKGIFLQNVVGLWVQSYKADGTLLVTSHSSYDSNQYPYNPSASSPVHSLPAYVVISIAVLDGPSARILQKANASSSTPPAVISGAYASSANAELFVSNIQASSAPAYLKRGISAAMLKVALENYR